MFDFIDKLLQGFIAPEAGFQQSSFLPSLEITDKLRLGFNKEYLDFITRTFLTAQKSQDLHQENRLWFLEEIAYHLKLCYPTLSLQEYDHILQQLIDEETEAE